MTNPITIECTTCEAKPGNNCTDGHSFSVKFPKVERQNFHNIRKLHASRI